MGGSRQRIIDSVEAARGLFAPVFDHAPDERLYIAYLDAARKLVGLRIRYAVCDGQVEFPMRDIVADAVTLDATDLILAHNHPSGDPTPSTTDIATTRCLAQVTRPIGITLRDHLVFGGGRFVSFRQRGLL